MNQKTRLSEAIKTVQTVSNLAKLSTPENKGAALKMLLNFYDTDRAAINAIMHLGKSNLVCTNPNQLLGLPINISSKKELAEYYFNRYCDIFREDCDIEHKVKARSIESIIEETERLPMLLKQGIEMLSSEE